MVSFVFVVNTKSQTLVGDATGTCDCFTLTTAAGQGGAVLSPGTIDLTNPFDFTFNIYLGTDDVWGADGLAFVLKQTGTGMGATGNALGYGGIPNSIAVEVDTWNSSPAITTDIASDHVALDLNGSVEHDLVGPTPIPNVEDGLYHLLRITWDPGTMQLEVFLDGTSYFVYTGDIVTIAFGGNPIVYFGITASTGGAFNEQGVCMYRNADFSADLTTVCVGQTVTFTDASTSDLNMITEYSWDFGDGTTSLLQNPTHDFMVPGTYTVELTITDVSGCSDIHTVDIVVEPELSISTITVDITCFGDDDGTATATPTTGTGPYSFIWDDPLGQTVTTASDLPPGTYNVDVTDAAGCVGTASVLINEPSALNLDAISITNASCGLSNGAIDVTVSGGTPAYQYSMDGGTTFSPSSPLTGLADGTYNVLIEDANGCQISSTETVGLDSPLSIDAISGTDVTCGPTPDGTITITASSGVTPYSYSLDGITYQVSNIFTGLTAGTYTVYVLDNSGCEITSSITINDASTLTIDGIGVTDVTCNGGTDGTIDISVSSGTAPYQYSIDGGTTHSASPIYSGLIAGTYAIEVVDDNGCVEATTTTINEPSPLSITPIITEVSCFGGSDGSIDLSTSGGTPVYSYSIDGGVSYSPSSIFNALSAGTYDVSIIDAALCEEIALVIVSEPAELIIDAINVNDVTCNGLSDGEIEIILAGGTAPYNYSADGGTTFSATNIFTGISAGTVDVVVVDNNGCSVFGTAAINESEPLVATLASDTMICQAGTAVLCPTLSGGTAPYIYYWDGFAGSSCLSTSTAGTYNLEVEDANGCTSAVVSQGVDLYPSLNVAVSPDVTICPGDEVSLSAEASGGIGLPYSYAWTNSIDGTILTGQIQTVFPTEAGTYTVFVEDACETPGVAATVNVSIFPFPAITYAASPLLGCQPLKVNFENTTDLSQITEFEWFFGNGETSTAITDSVIYEEAACFDVGLNMTTVDGCSISDTSYSMICVLESPVANFSFSPSNPDLLNPAVEFYNESENAVMYSWDFGDGNTSNEVNPSNVYPEISPMDYEVKLITISIDGCVDSVMQIIHISEVVLFFIPNTFTPNNDPLNDQFQPIFIPGFIPKLYEFRIFNRWGELVWETNDVSDFWDGSYQGILVEDGTYVWQLTFLESESDKKYQYFGHVNVMK